MANLHPKKKLETPAPPPQTADTVEAPKKSCRRPRKAMVVENATNVSEPAPSEEVATKQKRGRKPATIDNEDNDSCNKKQKTSSQPMTKNAQPAQGKATKKPQGKKQLATRDALPNREGRNEHPGTLQGVAPARRRSSQEVAAEREALRKAAEEQIRKGKEATLYLAQIQFAQEQDDDAMEVDCEQRLSAITRSGQRGNQYGAESEGEEFESVDSAESEPEPVAKKGKKGGKGKKGVRSNVENMVKELREVQKGRGVGPGAMSLPNSDMMPKKYNNSGLLQLTGKEDNRHQAGVAFGGLDDEHIEQDRPLFPASPEQARTKVQYPPNLRRDASRKNELVTSVDVRPNPRSKRQNAQPGKPGKATARPLAAPVIDVEMQDVDDDGSRDDKPMNQAQWSTSPQWTNVFLPSLTHALYVSREPFDDFKKDSSQFLATVQQVFALSHPEILYKFRKGDPLLSLAARRMNEKKSKLGAAVLELVKGIVEDKAYEYRGQPDKIRDYVRWVLKTNAMQYLKPTLMTCRVKPGEEGYIKPEGLFQSKLIVQVATQFLGYARNSKLKPKITGENPPKGLYALILTAIERAFVTFLPKGIFSEPKDFSHTNFNHQMRVFVTRIEDRISTRRWKEELLPSLTNELAVDEADLEGDLSIVSTYRGDFYVPPSPIKA